MKRRRVFLVATVVMVMLGSTVAAGAGQLGPNAYGWWWKLQPELAPAKVPPPPGTPPGGLYVASDVTGPQSIAALRFVLANGLQARVAVLRVAQSSGDLLVQLCPTTALWVPDQGGAIEQAPQYDCRNAVKGTVAQDGSSVTFATAALQKENVLDVAVVAAPDVTGAYPVFSASFDIPGTCTLTVDERPETSNSFSPPTTVTPPVSDPVTAEQEPAEPAGVVASPSEAEPSEDEGEITAAPSFAERPAAAGPEGTARARPAILLFLLAVALTYAVARNQRGRPPRLLGALADGRLRGPRAAVHVELTPEPTDSERGVGRFRRLRDGAPPKL